VALYRVHEDMAGVILYCSACGGGYASTGERPTVCRLCHRKDVTWSTSPPIGSIWHQPLKLTVTDRQFLRSLRIVADE
jgi:hypothetical protein